MTSYVSLRRNAFITAVNHSHNPLEHRKTSNAYRHKRYRHGWYILFTNSSSETDESVMNTKYKEYEFKYIYHFTNFPSLKFFFSLNALLIAKSIPDRLFKW